MVMCTILGYTNESEQSNLNADFCILGKSISNGNRKLSSERNDKSNNNSELTCKSITALKRGKSSVLNNSRFSFDKYSYNSHNHLKFDMDFIFLSNKCNYESSNH